MATTKKKATKKKTSSKSTKTSRPKRSTRSRSTRASTSVEDGVIAQDAIKESRNDAELSKTPKRNNKALYVLLLVGALIGVVLLNRKMYLAATVNGAPVFRWDLNAVLTSRFGEQTLEGIVSEMLIEQAATKEGIDITDEELAARQQQIVESLGGDVSIDDLLRYQGMSKEDFDKQIRTQILVEKILGKDIVITDDDVTNFISTNSAMLVATEESKMREEARQAILDNEIGKRVQSWFNELKDAADIMRYL